MIVRLQGCAVSGIKAHSVQTEVHLIQGAKFHLVGLPIVKKAAARLFLPLAFRIPISGEAHHHQYGPADIPKEGAATLPMALGIFSQCQLGGWMNTHYGRTFLDGRLVPIKALSMAPSPRIIKQRLHLAPTNAREATLVVVSPSTADDLEQVVVLQGEVPIPESKR